ncbi:sigma-70 family RNA polymerase sigma factor [Mycobacterium shimoidei]|uniref:sigma-70 family RNA polymerase sigma factor n=1 Tax=Mycobacterium shimoidei TaxID=29313 RepID=UPI0008486383|nr:sigma-70 family RNA polymerase sigma factor [Mycobacterium shimoidei]MCV7259173.1 sigma-70 family RNA polymerase sigma factor [Mycobacterium shimoidei]ODR13031.1 RNA polymerase subunit sigma [Mycobacterium shimoidei]ORW83367.1 RNA polymerase subunit sigma [Mycobacterium shimoidei]
MSAIEELARRFDADRRHLRSVAFHLLGSAADAEDAVQAAWLKASRADPDGIENPTGWFTTITAREALDQLRTRKRRAEQPLEAWEPAPVMPVDEDVLLADAVDRALLVVIDRLTPEQRVAFVLHDVFGVPFETIGDLLGRSAGAAKKLASRARGRVRPAPSAEPSPTAEHVRIVQAFLEASRGGDIATLLELLAPNVIRRVDRVLVPADVPTEVRGARQVAEETRQFTQRARVGVVVLVDGAPGIAIAPAGRLQALLRIGIREGRVHTIDIVGDPGRLRDTVLALPR